MRRYRVWMCSRSGMYAQYEGHVDVACNEGDDPFQAAVRKLQATAFPDRGADCWRMERCEVLG